MTRTMDDIWEDIQRVLGTRERSQERREFEMAKECNSDGIALAGDVLLSGLKFAPSEDLAHWLQNLSDFAEIVQCVCIKQGPMFDARGILFGEEQHGPARSPGRS